MRQEKSLRQHRVGIHSQDALRFRVSKDCLRFVHVGKDRQATLIKCAAVQGDCNMPGRPFKQSRADIRLQSLYRLGGRGTSKPQIRRSGEKAAPVDNPYE